MTPSIPFEENLTEEFLVHTIDQCSHEAYAVTKIFRNGQHHEITPVLVLSNDDDSFYTEVFRNRSELNVFIDQLQTIANELWPEESSKITFELAQQEIAYFDSNGFSYKGQLIEDAGEAYRLLLEVLYAQKQKAAS